jgi:hypothetical protein
MLRVSSFAGYKQIWNQKHVIYFCTFDQKQTANSVYDPLVTIAVAQARLVRCVKHLESPQEALVQHSDVVGDSADFSPSSRHE